MSVRDTDLLQGPVPVQWLPENQHPDVAHSVDEVTGIITPLDGAAIRASAPKAARRKDPGA